MRIVLQRVLSASVVVEGVQVAAIKQGLLCLLGFAPGDHETAFAPCLDKITNLRIFPDDAGRFDRSVLDIGGDILWVPQFTLYGECEKGRRPSFSKSLPSAEARELFARFKLFVTENFSGRDASFGIFGANMQVSLCNDGPVTLILDF